MNNKNIKEGLDECLDSVLISYLEQQMLEDKETSAEFDLYTALNTYGMNALSCKKHKRTYKIIKYKLDKRFSSIYGGENK